VTPFDRVAPSAPAGVVAAFPSDIAYGNDGTLYDLSYVVPANGVCSKLRRFDNGWNKPPTELPVGCVSSYAQMQFASSGVLYLLTDAPGGGPRVGLAYSTNNGSSWTFTTVSLQGLPANGDVSYSGFTAIKPYTSPTIYDPNRLIFFFHGADGTGAVKNSYMGEIDLAP
jgi:hypothetical protein